MNIENEKEKDDRRGQQASLWTRIYEDDTEI